MKYCSDTLVTEPGSAGHVVHALEADMTILILSNTGTTSLDELAARLAEEVIKAE